jgi:transposase-like protein
MINRSNFTRYSERQKESGLSIKSFCSNEGIAPSTFYYWQKKIRNESNGQRFIPLVVKSAEATINQATQREPLQRQRCDDIFVEIIYPNGTALRIKNDLELTRLRALISLLD